MILRQLISGIFKNHRRFPKPASDSVDWEQWWQDKVARDEVEHFRARPIEAPLVRYKGRHYDVANHPRLLQEIMLQNGLKTVLCVGNGVSREPLRLADAGFEVTALDLSPTAIRLASSLDLQDRNKGIISPETGPDMRGQIHYVVGDLFDATLCPGPFDVVIERRTVQRIPAQKRPAALSAIANRLSEVGIFLSHCNDDEYSPIKSRKFFHASESWLRDQRWQIWDDAPSSVVGGRVAWLVHSSS